MQKQGKDGLSKTLDPKRFNFKKKFISLSCFPNKIKEKKKVVGRKPCIGLFIYPSFS